MIKLTEERKQELIDIAETHIQESLDNDFTEYTAWDGLIECEETISYEEWKWMMKNLKFTAKVELKDDAKNCSDQ